MCQCCREKEARDARFWRALRRALMMAVKAIGDRYPDSGEDRRAA